MIRSRILMVSVVLVSFFLVLRVTDAQDRAMSSAPAFSGGAFVTPVPGAPFSAVVEQDMTQVLKDGSSFKRKTSALVARDSQGRIRNERHEVLPSSSTRKPQLFLIHIYDPETRLNTFLNPNTHIARQRTLPNPPSTEPPSNQELREPGALPHNPYLQVQDLGVDSMDGIEVHGYRKTTTIPAMASGIGRRAVVTDEYWYSEELHINMLTKHDPRTGKLTVTVTQVNRDEPVVDLFAVPPDYKVVDMTPPEAETQNPVRVVR
jgi:hypothetical protein